MCHFDEQERGSDCYEKCSGLGRSDRFGLVIVTSRQKAAYSGKLSNTVIVNWLHATEESLIDICSIAGVAIATESQGSVTSLPITKTERWEQQRAYLAMMPL